MYKVFINDSSIELARQEKNEGQSYQGPAQLKALYEEILQSSEVQHRLVLTDDIKAAWEDLKSIFKEVPAAGGLVKNPKGDLLMIHRLEKWDLPKGKIEKGEKVDEAAQREVMEECGVSAPNLLCKLPSTFHTYQRDGEDILKETHWYEMYLDQEAELTPQEEEDIAQAEWVPIGEVKDRMKQSYPSLQWLVDDYLKS